MPLKIKTKDLETLSKLHPKIYENVWGYYVHEKDEIWLDKRLLKAPDRKVPYRKEIEYHERAHRLMFLSGATELMGDEHDEYEEAFCDLWVIYRYPLKKLVGLERRLKARIMKQKGKRAQYREMLHIIGLKDTKAILDKLAGHAW